MVCDQLLQISVEKKNFFFNLFIHSLHSNALTCYNQRNRSNKKYKIIVFLVRLVVE